KSAYQNWKKDMPVLLLSGEKDPVGDFTKGVRRVEAAMKNADMKNVTVQFLPGARHDIFHEVKSGCAKQVVQLIKNWINV
ncbi:MAG: alpha/beta hydrolase, partial [Lachnospiraceae bacterium]|nr:alpha/beta hydrolase [Lachnospiraceae bacterium]